MSTCQQHTAADHEDKCLARRKRRITNKQNKHGHLTTLGSLSTVCSFQFPLPHKDEERNVEWHRHLLQDTELDSFEVSVANVHPAPGPGEAKADDVNNAHKNLRIQHR
jgi:hypothetical protein